VCVSVYEQVVGIVLCLLIPGPEKNKPKNPPKNREKRTEEILCQLGSGPRFVYLQVSFVQIFTIYIYIYFGCVIGEA